jgi:hypothetical protein
MIAIKICGVYRTQAYMDAFFDGNVIFDTIGMPAFAIHWQQHM